MLEAFDTAARTCSFTAAARELNLTQGAISKQVIALEGQLGVQLFERRRHSLVLTETGQAYAHDVRKALDLILSASLRIMTNPGGGRLDLAVLPTFGTRWLIPRLPGFLKAHPGVTVNFVTRLKPFDFRNDSLHAAIHFGLPDWPNAQCTYLMGEDIVPICSPDFREEYGVKSSADLASAPLLHISTRQDAWDNWFREQEMMLDEHRGMVVEEFLTAIQAALVGMGAALLPKFLVERELQSGELVIPVDRSYTSKFGYYLVVPDHKTAHRPTMAFRDWLLETVTSEA
jgi:LysR family glycine cleavage system transcriptional activator